MSINNKEPKDRNLCANEINEKDRVQIDNQNTVQEEPEKAPSPCVGCPYGRHHEICFPCWKKLLGQGGVE